MPGHAQLPPEQVPPQWPKRSAQQVDLLGAHRLDTGRSPSDAEDRIAEMYRLHVPGGIRLAVLIVGDVNLAQDAAHEAFIRVAGRSRLLRASDAFGAYYRRATVNAALSAVRSSARRTEREARYAALASREQVPAPEDDGSLLLALDALPSKQRAALVLRYWADIDDEESARLLRCRPATVRSTIARGLATLRKALAHE